MFGSIEDEQIFSTINFMKTNQKIDRTFIWISTPSSTTNNFLFYKNFLTPKPLPSGWENCDIL
jgi:uncharacterized protein YpiB (UPF0302 family)